MSAIKPVSDVGLMCIGSTDPSTSPEPAKKPVINEDVYVPPEAPSCNQTQNPTRCRVTKGGIYVAGGVAGGGMVASGALSLVGTAGATEAAGNLFLLVMTSSLLVVAVTAGFAIFLSPSEAY